MPVLCGCALLIVLAAAVAENVVPLSLWVTPFLGGFLGLLLSVARSFLLTPIMIAAHRYIILGEVTQGYVLDPLAPGFQIFFGWLVALSVLSSAATLVQELVMAAGLWIVVTAAVFIIGIVVVVAITARLSILFPAVAVGAPQANAANAWADSEGHVLRIFLVFVAASVPLMAVTLLKVFALGPGITKRGSVLEVVDMIVSSPLQAGFVILYVAVASRLFQALGRRLIGPANATP